MKSKDKEINDTLEKTMKGILDQAYDEMIQNFSWALSSYIIQPMKEVETCCPRSLSAHPNFSASIL